MSKIFTNEQLNIIYATALDHQRMVTQWARMQKFGHAAEYQAKLEAIVELLENITVFKIGDGLDNFKNRHSKLKTAEERLATFDKLFVNAKRTQLDYADYK